MSGLFGSSSPKPSAWQTPTLAGLQIQQSGYSQPVPIVYGTGRVSPTLMYYTDWKTIAHTTSQSTGGKGGGGGGSVTNTTYTYSATVCFMLAEGSLPGVLRIWRNNVTYANPAAVGFTIFNGTYPQAPWGYLTSAHPTEALGYSGSAYAAFANYDLGSNGSLGNHLFEVEGAIPGNGSDANPADVINDFLNNQHYGVLAVYPNAWYPTTFLARPAALGSWCANNGIYISPVVDTQRAAHDWITDWLTIANAVGFWSEGMLKIMPYGMVAPPVYNLTDDDFIVTGTEDPVIVTRKRRSDAYNDVSVEYLDRANEYTPTPARVTDQSAIETYGVRSKPTVTLHAICLPALAQQVAQNILMRELYILNTFQFKLSQQFCLLEPMDVVTITDSMLGLNQTPVLITTIEEDAGGLLTITAEEYNAAFYSGGVNSTVQARSGYIPNLGTAPTIMSSATLFLAPPAATASGNEIWMAVSNLDPVYAGTQIYLSYDDVTYQSIGVIYGSTTSGVITTNLGEAPSAAPGVLDTGNTLSVDLRASNGALASVNQATLLTYGTLSLVGNEFIAWRDATLTATSQYMLDTLLRGLYYSADQGTAPPGARFIMCDATLFRYPYDPALQGKTLYFKFVAFNAGAVAVQDIAQVPAVAFTVGGQLSVPPAPSGLTIAQSGMTVNFSWIGSSMTGARYELRYVPQGNAAEWDDGMLIATSITQISYASSQVVPGAWVFLLAAQDSGGNYSTPTVLDFTVTNTQTVQIALDCAPEWHGTLSGMVEHWTGKIIPQGQNPTVDDVWDTFDAQVSNPFPICAFESGQTLDLGSVKTVRAWAAFSGTLPIPGGVSQPQLWINTSLDGVTYTGYSQWSNGTVTARFIKVKTIIDTSIGTPCLSEFNVTLDM